MALALSFKLDSTTLAVIGGSLAVAIGLSLRDLVSSFIAGITIMFDRPFQVGDRVAFAGRVRRHHQDRPAQHADEHARHNIITIPNNKVLTDVPVERQLGRARDADARSTSTSASIKTPSSRRS